MSDVRKQIDDKKRARKAARAAPTNEAEFMMKMGKAMEHLMSNPDMREFVWWFSDQDSCDLSCFTGNSKTYYDEGKKDNAKSKQLFMKRVNMKLYHQMEVENSPLMKDKEK